MRLRFGSHSLGRIRRGQESRYLGRANLHDNFLENASQLWAFTYRNAAINLTVPTDGWTLRDSRR